MCMSRIMGLKNKFNIKVFLPFPVLMDTVTGFFFPFRWALPSFFADEQLALGMVGHDLSGSDG